MIVLILGATGLVGSELLKLLLEHKSIQQIHCINRKSQHYTNDKITEWIGDYNSLNQILTQLPHVDALYCCLGTTKSQTPDQNLYRQLEIDYPLTVATYLQGKGLLQLHYISSLGAKISSNIFYSKTKGEAENALEHLKIYRTYIYRPSLIVGPRKDKRMLEGISATFLKIINPLLIGSFAKYKSIDASTIAKCITTISVSNEKETTRIIDSDEIQAIANSNS